jgi:hypothetical protein
MIIAYTYTRTRVYLCDTDAWRAAHNNTRLLHPFSHALDARKQRHTRTRQSKHSFKLRPSLSTARLAAFCFRHISHICQSRAELSTSPHHSSHTFLSVPSSVLGFFVGIDGVALDPEVVAVVPATLVLAAGADPRRSSPAPGLGDPFTAAPTRGDAPASRVLVASFVTTMP